MKHYDVLVIGSGGGTKLVRPVAELNKKVAIVDKGPLGGTCLNRGCIPSKMLLHTAHLASLIRDSKRFEIQIEGSPPIDFPHLIQRVAQTIDAESAYIAPLYKKNPLIDYYHEEACFIDSETVQVGDENLTADKIFIAVGARAAVPPIPGLKEVPFWSYEEALRPKKQPKKLLVIGGGYIATELGYFYSAVGTKTEFFVRSELLRREDDEIKTAFKEAFEKQVELHVGCDFNEVTYNGSSFHLHFTDYTGKKQVSSGDALLVATGIQPWTDVLGLEKTSIKCDEKGFVIVDDHLKTTQKNVWALGDCVGKYLFRHSVNFEGEYLFRTLFKEPSNEPISYPPVPHAVFSHPEVAAVGKTERELKKEKTAYIVGKQAYADSARGMALMPKTGFVKLLFEKESLKLLGAHIIGEEAATMIHMLIALMNQEGTLHDLLSIIYIHPALPEVVRNAARQARAQLNA